MTPAQLKAFACVVRLGSVKSAAQELGVSEAAVSIHVGHLRKELDDKIAGILTDAERPAFNAIRERFAASGTSQAGRVFLLGPDRKPQGVTIRIGASDGAQTEVVAGLEAGREVIIGGGPATATQRGPRFGF